MQTEIYSHPPNGNIILLESSTNSIDVTNGQTKPSKSQQKKNRVRVSKACTQCQSAHMSCDNARPCKRCIDKGHPHQCQDAISKKRGRKKGGSNEMKTDPHRLLLEVVKRNAEMNDPQKKMKMETQAAEVLSQTFERFNANRLDSSPLIQETHLNSLIERSSSSNLQTLTSSLNHPLAPRYLGDFRVADDIIDLPINLISDFFSPLDQIEFFKWTSISESEQEYYNVKKPNPMFSSEEFFHRFLIQLAKRLPEDAGIFAQSLTQLKHKVHALRENLCAETASLMIREFETHLNLFKSLFDEMAVPSLVWERCGVIHYVNQAYKDLTGFSSSVPTNHNDFSMLKHLSPPGLKTMISSIIEMFNHSDYNSLTFPTGVLVTQKGEERYLEGTMCVTIKRDVIGLPLIFQGCFLPTIKEACLK